MALNLVCKLIIEAIYVMAVHIGMSVGLQWLRIFEEFLRSKLIAYFIVFIAVAVVAEFDLCFAVATNVQGTLLIACTT